MVYLRELDGKLVACCRHCHEPLVRAPPKPGREDLVHVRCSSSNRTCVPWETEPETLLAVQWEGEYERAPTVNVLPGYT